MTEYVTIKRGSPLWPDGQWTEWTTFHCPFWLDGKAGTIRVSADHPAAKAQAWNDANPLQQPFDALWFGGDGPPADWDGCSSVLRFSGELAWIKTDERMPVWRHTDLPTDIIAYRRKQIDRSGYVNTAPNHEKLGAMHSAGPVKSQFQIGARVEKIKGSSWRGRIVGSYSTRLTPIGWCVESEREPGSVQLYPQATLCVIEPDPLIAQIADAEGLPLEQAARIVAKVREARL